MKGGNKYLPEILAMLSTVIADYAKAITDTAYYLPRKRNTSDEAGYLSYSDKAIRQLKTRLREDIFTILSSAKFVRRFPKMKQIIKIEGSAFEKEVILLTGLGIDPDDVASLLQTNRSSITSIRSKRKEDIDMIFG